MTENSPALPMSGLSELCSGKLQHWVCLMPNMDAISCFRICMCMHFVGGFPYPTTGQEDLLPLLKAGYRMEKPDNCSEEVLVLTVA